MNLHFISSCAAPLNYYFLYYMHRRPLKSRIGKVVKCVLNKSESDNVSVSQC